MKIRPRRRDDDSGFALIYVLLVIMIVTFAVTGTLAVTTPDVSRATGSVQLQGANAAARAGVDDFIAWVGTVSNCRTTTRVCAEALGAKSTTTSPARAPLPAASGAMAWWTEPALTSAGNVRVHATGNYGTRSVSLVGDVALAPSILSYGYYSDYETPSPDVLVAQSPARSIYVDNGDYSTGTLVKWNGLSASDVSDCAVHYWDDGSTKGRNSVGSSYTERGSVNGSSKTRSGGCGVVFTSGNTFNGPVYTRDAMLINDVNGQGPVFNKPVLTGWGYATQLPAPADPSTPWLKNGSNCCTLPASQTPYRPVIARFDLQLPATIGTAGLASNACVFVGPTRVKLNGDGTATVTSPRTTAAVSGADSRCYPSTFGSNGVLNYTFDYRAVGGGTILARNVGTKPSTSWPVSGLRPTTVATKTNTAIYTSAIGTPPTPDPSITESAYTTPVAYNCGTYKTQFECDSNATYATFQQRVATALNGSNCLTQTAANQPTCVMTAIKPLLPSSGYSASTASAVSTTSDTATFTNYPAPPSTDSTFDQATTPGTRVDNINTTSVSVIKSTVSGGKTTNTTQFTFSTALRSTTSVTAPTASSFFPRVDDVTPYALATSDQANVPGDLYVEGSNTGKLSLLADNDVVVTGDVTDVSTNVARDAVNLVAAGNVRNYNPVSCVDTDATALAATMPNFCPNDLLGISANVNRDGSLADDHPAKQYSNILTTTNRRIDAAIFALQGSFGTDNNNRGRDLGTVTINGGLYQSHRGVNATLWGGTTVRSGYTLSYNYVDLRNSNLPYTPTTRTKSGRLWSLVAIAGPAS